MSQKGCTGSCIRYLLSDPTVKADPSLHGPRRSRWSCWKTSKRSASALAVSRVPSDRSGVLASGVIPNRRGVLVPVLEFRIVREAPKGQAGVEEAEDIAHLAGVLEGSPLIGSRPEPHVIVLEHPLTARTECPEGALLVSTSHAGPSYPQSGYGHSRTQIQFLTSGPISLDMGPTFRSRPPRDGRHDDTMLHY